MRDEAVAGCPEVRQVVKTKTASTRASKIS